MEIKHTIEILTKDIQDIEKLVRNLQNSPRPFGIELDLALSKLRNVYELLLLIKEDSVTTGKSGPDFAEPEHKHVEKTDTRVINKEPGPAVETEDGSLLEAEADEGKTVSVQPEQETEKPDKKEKHAEILAEKFNKEASLNENMASRRSGDVTAKISSQPIDSISRHIGINDRFFIIRELFNGDAESYNALIKNLDTSNTFNDAFQHIEKQFSDKIDTEGVQILVNLARRRFISSGNV